MPIQENTSSMEPMLPPEGASKLEDLTLELASKASGLASRLPLLKKGSLKSKTALGPLNLSFPIGAVERWFPKLYPMS